MNFDLTNERWLPLPGFEGYEISDMGRLKSLPRVSMQKRQQGKMLKLRTTREGYVIGWAYKNGERAVIIIHRIVGKLFVPNPFNYPELNHKFGDKLDNRATSLEWITKSGNLIHAYRTGLRKSNKGKTLKKTVS